MAGAKNPGMGKGVGQLKDRARQTLGGFSTGQKVVTAIAVLGVLVGGYVFSAWAGKPTYTPLFTNLNPTDAAAMTQKLTSSKVPFKLADGGTTVLVPQSSVYQQRLNMSTAGLPTNGNQGYKLLDKQGITTSEFQQQVNYQRAVEGELSKTINVISGVSASVVHVVIPANNIFSGAQNQPSAAVLVSMTPGQTMTSTQVQAVVHLVASSIENLVPGNVTVTDDKGDVLAAPGTDGASGAAGDAHSQQTNAFDNTMATSLQNMLAGVLGANKAIVHVSAELNFDQTQTTSKTFDPTKTGAVPVNDASSSEIYTGAGPGAAATAGGVLGTTVTTAPATTVPSTTATTTAGSQPGNYTKTDASHSYAVGEVDQTVTAAAGGIKRLSLAVMVDSSAKGVSQAQIQTLVSAAAGFNATRGDTIQVGVVPFDQSAAKDAAKALKTAQAGKSQAGLMATVRTVLILLVVAALVIVALRKLTKTTRTPLALDLPDDMDTIALGAGPGNPLALSSGSAGRSLTTGNNAERPLALVAAGATGSAAGSMAHAQAADLGAMIDRDPAEIAELLRSWLSEEKN